MASMSSLPFIKGSSPTRSLSVQVVAEQEASLLRQVEHWHQMYLDSEASFAQARADEALLQKQLSGALDRERLLASKNLELRCASQAKQADEEEETRKKVALCEQLSSAHVMLQRKEEELQESRRQSITRGEQVEKLKDDLQKKLFDMEQHKAMESEICDLRKKLDASLKKISAKEHFCDVMDQELKMLRSQLPAMEAELTKLKGDLKKKTAEAEQQNKSLQWELSDLQVRLDTSLQKMLAKEQELQRLQAHLKEKEDQLEKLQKIQKATNVETLQLELAELRGKLEVALKDNATKDHLFQVKELEVVKLKGELAKEHELCHAAVSDNCELRQICCEKLNALGEQEAKHQRSVQLLEAEREMWLSRSDHLEKVNTRLRLDLQKNLDVAEAEMTLTPTPPRRPSTARSFRDRPAQSQEIRLNYPRAGRTLLQHRACEGKMKNFDAEEREAWRWRLGRIFWKHFFEHSWCFVHLWYELHDAFTILPLV